MSVVTVTCPRCGTKFRVVLPESGCLTCMLASIYGCAPTVVQCPKCGLQIDLASYR